MARGTPSFFSGTIASLPQGGIVTQLRAEIETRLQAYQSNATTAWETWDTIDATPANLDRVYRSVGDRSLVSGAGDAALFIKIDKVSTDDIQFNAYQDWSNLSSTGSRQAGSTIVQWTNLNDFSECRFWGMVNEYEFVLVVKQQQAWHFVHFGSPIRSHIPSTVNGIAFTTASAAAGSNVTVNIDRDITGSILDSGDTNGPQNIWIYNLTPNATALRSATVDVTTVTTITATTITFANLANSFDSGAIVGLDPCPMFCAEDEILATGGSVDITLYFTNNVSGGYTAATSQIADYEVASSLITVASAEPGANGTLLGSRALISADQLNESGYRGVSELVAFVRGGALLDTDFWRPDFSTTNQYMIFPSLVKSTDLLAIGPGAT